MLLGVCRSHPLGMRMLHSDCAERLVVHGTGVRSSTPQPATRHATVAVHTRGFAADSTTAAEEPPHPTAETHEQEREEEEEGPSVGEAEQSDREQLLSAALAHVVRHAACCLPYTVHLFLLFGRAGVFTSRLKTLSLSRRPVEWACSLGSIPRHGRVRWVCGLACSWV